MIKLYYHNTPNPTKVAMFLEEAGIAYQVVGTDIWAGVQHSPEYRAINPNGKVPAMVDDNVTMFDSNAILLYLAEKTDKFLGKAEERPQLLSWLMFTASGLGPFSGQAFHFTTAHTDSAYATNRYLREVERHFSVLEKRLTDMPWLSGESYTIADIAAWGWVDFAIRNNFVFVEDGPFRWPNLKIWVDRINSHPAAEKARRAGDRITVKTEFDEAAARALFPQNFSKAL